MASPLPSSVGSTRKGGRDFAVCLAMTGRRSVAAGAGEGADTTGALAGLCTATEVTAPPSSAGSTRKGGNVATACLVSAGCACTAGPGFRIGATCAGGRAGTGVAATSGASALSFAAAGRAATGDEVSGAVVWLVGAAAVVVAGGCSGGNGAPPSKVGSARNGGRLSAPQDTAEEAAEAMAMASRAGQWKTLNRPRSLKDMPSVSCQ